MQKTVTILGHVVEKGSKAARTLNLAADHHRIANTLEHDDCPSLAAIERLRMRTRINRATCERGYVGKTAANR